MKILSVGLEIPQDLNEYLEAMAGHDELSVEGYVDRILKTHSPSIHWRGYPPDVAILLTLYQYAFDERVQTIKKLSWIHEKF